MMIVHQIIFWYFVCPRIKNLSNFSGNNTVRMSSCWLVPDRMERIPRTAIGMCFFSATPRVSGGVSKWNDQELDITFHEWPKPKEWIFTNPYGPVWPVKVLFDDTDGVFDAILKQTEEVYGKGSKVAYSTGCAERLNKLDRWVGKLEKYKNDFEVRFYYAGIAYEAFVRVWFEQRNLWPLPPAQALPFIRRNDVESWDLLSGFTRVNGRESVDMARAIAKQLQAI